MTRRRRIVVSLPDKLLERMHDEIATANVDRSEFIREGLEYYMAELRKRSARQQLADGYRAMATLNLELAQEAYDDFGLSEYETALSEGD